MGRYKGYHVVGFDGDDLNLPPSVDILEQGYRGFSIGKNHETHYLKMYLVKCVDLLSNVVLDFRQSTVNDEIGLAVQMFSDLPKKTIAIFDRLYLSNRLIDAHVKSRTYFIGRCKSGGTYTDITEFYHSNKTRSFFYYGVDKFKINLIKIKNPKNGEAIVVATNLDVSNWTNVEITNLYTLRWDCETNNRDSTSTLKVDQWHSKFFNGIMQEFYVHLIMMNISKITIFQEGGYRIDLEKNETNKANFKYIFTVIFNQFGKVLINKIQSAMEVIRYEINKTIEKRKRLSRSYPRQIRKGEKAFKNAGVVKKRSLK